MGKKDVSISAELPAPAAAGAESRSSAQAIEAFLSDARRLGPAVTPRPTDPRLVFALDATMSRQPTWDLACRVQAGMFEAAADAGNLAVQLVYFRGFGECRASGWVGSPRALTDLMVRIDCRGGQTQIGRVLRHVRKEAGQGPIKAFVYVGDAMEEGVDDLCALGGELGLLGVRGFLFQEGADPVARGAFQEIARLTGGAYARFDASAPQSLGGLLRAAAAYARGGVDGLRRVADREADARRLLTAMTGSR